ncbi:MAG: hypothetical protein ACRD0B_00440 [Acidimicrobiales bacterium]
MPTRRIASRHQRTADTLRDAGVEVTGRQVERWEGADLGPLPGADAVEHWRHLAFLMRPGPDAASSAAIELALVGFPTRRLAAAVLEALQADSWPAARAAIAGRRADIDTAAGRLVERRAEGANLAGAATLLFGSDGSAEMAGRATSALAGVLTLAATGQAGDPSLGESTADVATDLASALTRSSLVPESARGAELPSEPVAAVLGAFESAAARHDGDPLGIFIQAIEQATPADLAAAVRAGAAMVPLFGPANPSDRDRRLAAARLAPTCLLFARSFGRQLPAWSPVPTH